MAKWARIGRDGKIAELRDQKFDINDQQRQQGEKVQQVDDNAKQGDTAQPQGQNPQQGQQPQS